MSGYLYAVIFEQGTVKVGMTRNDVSQRMRCHYGEGSRWGIRPVMELTAYFETDDIEFRELALCGYCERESVAVGGYEWFRFDNAEVARDKVQGFLDKIKVGDFGHVQTRMHMYVDNKKERFDAAMVLIKGGAHPNDAAKQVGLHHISVVRKKEYLQWYDEQLEKVQQVLQSQLQEQTK